MNRLNLFRKSLALPLLVVMLATDSPVGAQAPASNDGAGFGQTRLWSIHLEIAPGEFDAMQRQ
jgi:hypothetical protein